MFRTIAGGLGLVAGLVLPAAADGYQTYGYAPQTSYERGVEVTRTYAPPQTVCQTSCCASACTAPAYTTTYVTRPVVTRTYTRTYSRLAPPDCYHPDTSVHDHAGWSGGSFVTGQYTGGAYTSGSYAQSSAYGSANSYAYAADTYVDGYAGYEDDGYYGYDNGVAVHDDRARPWAHYDGGWRR